MDIPFGHMDRFQFGVITDDASINVYTFFFHLGEKFRSGKSESYVYLCKK